MATSNRAKQRKSKHDSEQTLDPRFNNETTIQFHKVPPLVAKNEQQQRYINAIKNFKVTFGLGCAGTGKSYIACAVACDLLEKREIERIIITRPAVEAGESLGFLPGELEEKYEPYIAPFRDILNERLGKSHVENLLKLGRIEAVPFAYMRGRTFKDAFVILDEAQNASKSQMRLFLTRIGENCRVVIDGDENQTDLNASGLLDAVRRVQHIPCVKMIRFSKHDVVRSGFVAEVVAAYESEPALL